MIKLLVLLCSLFSIPVKQEQEIKSITLVNGVVKKCQVCGKLGSVVRITNGVEEVYCWKHFNGDFKP